MQPYSNTQKTSIHKPQGGLDIYQVLKDMSHGSTQTPVTVSPSVLFSTAKPLESKLLALTELHSALVPFNENNPTAVSLMKSILGHERLLNDFFNGLRGCLHATHLQSMSTQMPTESAQSSSAQVSDDVVDIILKANQVLFELMPDVNHHNELEMQVANTIPIFIENLGSPKAVVRKSTHKCIGTYVKLTKKLEYVLLNLIGTGLENQTSRTRQHSMLVVPALLSLKTQIMEEQNMHMKEMVMAVIKRIRYDQSEIVAKTGKKLLLELQKCYPQKFKLLYIETLRSLEDQKLCNAVLQNDEAAVREIISNQAPMPERGASPAYQKQHTSQSMPAGVTPTRPSKPPVSVITQKTNELNKVGLEIISKSPAPYTQQNSALYSEVDGNQMSRRNESIASERQVMASDSKFPRAANGLLFGFLKDETLQKMNDQNEWKVRATTFEHIENELNYVLASPDKKKMFLPFGASFLDLMIEFIKDIHFKICLTAIQITNKLLVLDSLFLKQHTKQITSLISAMIEKLSDSKVVIRQAVLKCCSLIISSQQYFLMQFLAQTLKSLHHTNWHVREGILHLIANCLIVQSQQDELNGGILNNSSNEELNHPSVNKHLIQQLSQLVLNEQKTKIQQMAIDCLALILDISPTKKKTELLMVNELGINNKGNSDKFQSYEYKLIGNIKERSNKDYLPTMQIDGSIEFKPSGILSDVLPSSPTKIESKNLYIQQSPKSIRHDELPKEEHQLNMRFQEQRVHNRTQANKSPQENKLLDKRNIARGEKSTRADEQNPYVHAPELSSQQQALKAIVRDNQNKTFDKPPSNSQFSVNEERREDIRHTPNHSMQYNLIGSGLQPEGSINSQYDDKSPELKKNDGKISMWLHSYNNPSTSEHPRDGQQSTTISNQPYQMFKMDKLSGTASSSATFLEDGSSNIPSSHVTNQNHKQMKTLHEAAARSPLLKDEDISVTRNIRHIGQNIQGYTPEQHQNKPRHIHSNEIRQRNLNEDNFSHTSNKTGNVQINNSLSIQQSPRMIIGGKLPPESSQAERINQIKSQSDIKMQQRNMSQSSGAAGGFNIDKTQINQRLQLLKSTFKYKNASEIDQTEETKTFDNSDRKKYRGLQPLNSGNEYNPRGSSQRPAMVTNNNFMPSIDNKHRMPLDNNQQTHNSFGFSNMSSNLNNINSFSANKQLQQTESGFHYGRPTNTSYTNIKGKPPGNVGPVKATALPQNDFMQTIQLEDNQSNMAKSETNQLYLRNQKSQPQPVRKKPPMNSKHISASTALSMGDKVMEQNRNHQISNEQSPSGFGSNYSSSKQPFEGQSPNDGQTTHYMAQEEPLRNPDLQFKQCIENLKSDDWHKVFDSLNIVKRIAMFHKELLANSNGIMTKECIKLVVKQNDNLRSQVAKNSCMTLQVIFSELPSKDLDPHLDLVLASLLKKATDTNHFVSEQADKALTMVCHACNESKLFNQLLQVPGRSNNIKQKICMCYSNIISKLGGKIKQFRECERLIKTVIAMLSEGAQEVRNQAKLALLTLKNNFPNGREFDSLLFRCNLTDQQMEQTKKVIEQSDFESLSNFANTRYGGSMRGSSLDSRGLDRTKQSPNQIQRNNNAFGSDGFSQSAFSDAKLQQTFMSGYGPPTGFGTTGTSLQAFKQRHTSVSKPVDPKLMEEFKTMISGYNVNDWNKRLQHIDVVTDWINQHSITIKQTQHSKFIQLVDIECKFLSDNNVKVQTKGLGAFRTFLSNDHLRALIDQNLTMIIQAITQNLSSSSPSIRNASEQLMELLENTTDTPAQLVSPIVAQINLSNTRCKPTLIERLAQLITKVGNPSMIERYVQPMVKPSSKLQNEANSNPRLREALKNLESTLMVLKG